MLELVNLSNYRTDLDLIDNNATTLARFLQRHELAGLELMFCESWDPSVHRREWIQGSHLHFWPCWLDFWRGDTAELLRQFHSEEAVIAIYGGLKRDDWLERYRDNIRRSVAAGAKYLVLHVCHNRLEEKGLAGRHLADGRAREQSLMLTAAGKTLVPQLAALADTNDAHFFDHLPTAERKALTQAMKDLVQHHQLKDIPTA